jgi:hypothetical protein
MNLRGVRVACTSSYLVSPQSARHLLQRLAVAKPPIDVRFDELMQVGAIKAAVMVPFLTGVDLTVGSQSDIQPMSEAEARQYIMLRTAFFVDRKRQPALTVRID